MVGGVRKPGWCGSMRRLAVKATLVFLAGVLLAGCTDRREKYQAEAERARKQAVKAIQRERSAAPDFRGVLFGPTPKRRPRFSELPDVGLVKILGLPLSHHIAYAYGFDPREVEVSGAFDANQLYNTRIRPADGGIAGASLLLRDELSRHFVLDVREEAREGDVFVLKRRLAKPLLLPSESKGEPTFEAKPGELHATHAPISELVRFLRRRVALPVVDETGLDAEYDFVMQWDTSRGSYAFVQALDDLGLTLEKGRGEFEVLIVEVQPAGTEPKSVAGESGTSEVEPNPAPTPEPDDPWRIRS